MVGMSKLLTALAILLLTMPALPQDEEGMTRISIEVKTAGGRPIDRASVVVRFAEGRSIAKFGKKIRTSYELRTNQDGLAKIPAIPEGKILVQVIAKGYQTFGQTFDVSGTEKTIEVKLNPPQGQYSSHKE
jgi:Carboxypeptidase regulatory-like domain